MIGTIRRSSQGRVTGIAGCATHLLAKAGIRDAKHPEEDRRNRCPVAGAASARCAQAGARAGVALPNMDAFSEFAARVFESTRAVSKFRTSVVMSRVKTSGPLPVAVD
jgi:hypothetical protein